MTKSIGWLQGGPSLADDPWGALVSPDVHIARSCTPFIAGLLCGALVIDIRKQVHLVRYAVFLSLQDCCVRTGQALS